MRALGLLVSACLALFLGAITFLVLDASYTGSPAGAWLFRAFFTLVVGGIAVGLLVFAYTEWRSPATPGGAIPQTLRAICPACGCQDRVEIRLCPACGFAASLHVEAWAVQEQGGGVGVLFFGVLGLGLSCLGLGVGLGPFLEGEDRLVANLAFGALGLLILAVGALMVWGALLALRSQIRREKTFRFSAYDESPDSRREIVAQAHFRHGHLRGAGGHVYTTDLRPVAGGAAILDPPREGFVHALVALHRQRIVQVLVARQARWSRAAGGALDGGEVRTINVSLTRERPDETALRLIEALRLPSKGMVAIEALWEGADQEALLAGQDRGAPAEDAEDARVAGVIREALGAPRTLH